VNRIVSGVAMAAIVSLAACGQNTQTAPPSEATAPVPAPAPDVIDPAITAAIAALPAPYNEANYANGKRISAQCRACHTFDAAGGAMVGPNLHGIFGRKAATGAGFPYSPALKKSDITWDWDKLDQWLAKPQSYVPGTRMTFLGVKKPEDRRDLIAFLEIETKR
jgi:cytochrome c